MGRNASWPLEVGATCPKFTSTGVLLPHLFYLNDLFFPPQTLHWSGNKKPRKKKKATSSDPMKPTEVSTSLSIDKSYLCCAHHRAMVAGLCLLKNPERLLGKLCFALAHE